MSWYPLGSREDDMPVRAMSAYRFFFHDRRGGVQMEHLRVTGQTISFADLSEIMMDTWDNLDRSTKAYYQELAAKDQRRYILERIVWEAKMEQEAMQHSRKRQRHSATLSNAKS